MSLKHFICNLKQKISYAILSSLTIKPTNFADNNEHSDSFSLWSIYAPFNVTGNWCIQLDTAVIIEHTIDNY